MNVTAGGAVGWCGKGAPLIKPPPLRAPSQIRAKARVEIGERNRRKIQVIDESWSATADSGLLVNPLEVPSCRSEEAILSSPLFGRPAGQQAVPSPDLPKCLSA